jgi:hypothetical protein
MVAEMIGDGESPTGPKQVGIMCMSAVGRAKRGDDQSLARTFGFGWGACTWATACTFAGSPIEENMTIQESAHGGIVAIAVTQSDNADTPAPPFMVGPTDASSVTATRINQSQARPSPSKSPR